jgi:hypothetical protein
MLNMTDSPDLITLRPAIAADRQFLLGVYAGTRLEELAALPWDEGQKEAFVQMQFDAQNQQILQKVKALGKSQRLFNRGPERIQF